MNFRAVRKEAAREKKANAKDTAFTVPVAATQQQALTTADGLQPSLGSVGFSTPSSTPMSPPFGTTAATHIYQTPAPVRPTIRPLTAAMQQYRREAEHRERQRPVELQDWSRFQAWWDASFREFQGYLLTQDETVIL